MSLHYNAPASLPSDYALLSRYAAARGTAVADDDDDDDETINDDLDAPLLSSSSSRDRLSPGEPSSPRRRSFPSSAAPFVVRRKFSRSGPLSPILDEPSTTNRAWPAGMRDALANENTPLLPPQDVPRIHETSTGDESGEKGVYWRECMILLKYTLPVFGTHVLEYSLVVASVIAIGHLSTTALAAATLGSMTASVSGYSILQGFASTLDTMLPSAWTSDQPNLVGLWAQRMAVVMAASLIPIVGIWLSSESILLFLRQDPEVAHLASLYLRWALLGLPAYAFNLVIRRYFQSQNRFSVPTHIITFIAPLNAFLNWLLVWGPEPVRLGFIGAPIATAISFNLVSIASLVYGVFFVTKTAWHPIGRRSFTSLGVLVQLGLAGVGQTASEWWSWELVGLAASLLGPVALAAQSVLLVSASTTYQAPFALSVASSVRIGNLLGERNAERAKVAAVCSLIIALGCAGISSALFIALRYKWALLFNDDPDVVALVAIILPLVAAFQVFDGLSAVTGGILRARGKQFTGALINLSAYYILGIPIGILLAFRFSLGLTGLWLGLTLSLVYASAVGVWLALLRTDWQREVQKVMQRLEADKVPVHAGG